jgi:trigger factor
LKVDYVEETSVRKALTFEIEPELVEKEIDKQANDLARKAKIPGFRPGKVPAHVIKQRFRGQVIEDALETIINKVVKDELEGRGLKPVASPKVTDLKLKLEEHEPLTFRAVFETLPFIEVPDYKGLAVKTRKAEVKDEAVDAEIDQMRERAARYEPVEGRPSQTGDFASLDIEWTPKGGGQPGHDHDALIEIGAESNHADLNAKLVGVSAGDAGAVTVAYAADHPSPGLAGTTVDYKFTVKGIQKKVVPAADDEFAKDMGDFDTLGALKEEVKKRLVVIEENEVDSETKAALVEAIVEKASFEVPEALIERHMNARTEQAIRSLAMQGVDPKKLGTDRWKEYRESQREPAQKAAKAELLLDEIARREGITVKEGELDAEIERIARRAGRPKAQLRRQLEQDGDLVEVAARLRESKTLDLLKANARLESR